MDLNISDGCVDVTAPPDSEDDAGAEEEGEEVHIGVEELDSSAEWR